jgi:hypothetical protein
MLREIAFIGLMTACSAVAHADWLLDFEGGVLHDSNLTNAQLQRDTKSDSAVTASFSGAHSTQLSRDFSVAVALDLRSEAYQRFSGMTNASAGTTLSVKRKLGVGAAAPWIRLSAAAARLEFNDRVRDGWLYGTALAGGQRIAQRWELQVRYSVDRRKGDNEIAALRTVSGDVFDLRAQTLTLDLRYALSDGTLLFAGYAWRDGDVVSSSTPNAKIFASSSAITPDAVFGPNHYAYKLDASSRLLNAGVSQVLSRRSALNVTYQRQVTHAQGDNNYYKNVFAATYAHSFF